MSKTERLKILFLTPRFPYPLIGGDRLKPFMVLKHLARIHDVTLVTFAQGKVASSENIEVLKNLGIKLHTIPLDPIKAGLRTLPLTLFAGQPLEIAYYNQPEFGLKVDQLINRNRYDLAIAFFMRTAEYIKNADIAKLLMAEDCRTVYQQRSFEQSTGLKQKFIRWWEVKKLRNYEPKIMRMFDAVSFVTKEDIDNMRLIFPQGNYELLTNGTDIEKFSAPEDNNQRKGILFAGKLDIWANVLMIQRIAGRILPLIREKHPEVMLTIAGANPPKSILSLASDYIRIEPDVPEMVPYLQKAELFIHPHDGGSGIQNKLIEAMSCQCPVVTTPTGTQGLHAVDGENIMIAGNDRNFADKVIMLLENKELAAKIGINARKTIVDNLSWNTVYSQADNIISSIISK